jgi:hypothetical protein
MSAADDVKELLDARREFTFELPGTTDEPTLYFIGTPSGEDIRKADWEYSKIYAQAITDKLLTHAQMADALKAAGILSPAYEAEVEQARITLGAELFRLENLMEDADDTLKEDNAREVGRLRDELFLLNQRVNGPMANTCENLAEDARTDFLTSRIVENKDGTRVWEDYQDYRGDDNTGFTVRSRFEVMLWMQGLESNFLENTPEQRTLRAIDLARAEAEIAELEEDLKAESASEVETVELPDEIPVPAEVVEKPKKTRGRPKSSAPKSKPKAKGKPAPKPKKPGPTPESD